MNIFKKCQIEKEYKIPNLIIRNNNDFQILKSLPKTNKRKKTRLRKKHQINFDTKVISFYLKFIALIVLLIVINMLKMKDKIVISIFAGRKKYLEILMVYLNYLKSNKKISEIHFWQFSNNQSDIEYLNSISNIHKTNGYFMNYVDIYPEIKDNYFIIKIIIKNIGACLLINNKYEIIFIRENYRDIKILFNENNNNIISTIQYNVYKINEYLQYKIKIFKHRIIIIGKSNMKIKYKINEDKFESIKIKSLPYSETIWDYKETINKGVKLYDTIYRAYTHWYEMYKFYLNYDFGILIKLDDDISFIDIDRFDEFIDFIKLFKKNVTFPNMVNHAVSLFYNQKEGLIPKTLINKTYMNKSSSIDIFNYYQDGREAKKIHKYFLENVEKFTHNNVKPFLLNGQRPSICMFGITKESFKNVYSPKAIWPKNGIPNNYFFDDEVYTYNLYNNYLYPRFVCIHYAFGPQRKSGLDEIFLEDYKNLSYKYIIKRNNYFVK